MKHYYHKLEVQHWERQLGLLTKIFNETNVDIIKFYLDKTMNRLAQTLMIFPFSKYEVERLFCI